MPLCDPRVVSRPSHDHQGRTGADALRHRRAGEPRQRAIAGIEEAAGRARRSSACRSCSARSTSASARTPPRSTSPSRFPGRAPRRSARPRRRAAWSVMASLFEKRAAGVFHNTAVLIDADGALAGLYRKMHIPDDPLYYEKFYFTPGDLGFRSFDTAPRPGRRAGVLGSVVSRGGAADRAARRRDPLLSDGDRLASAREGRVRRGAARRLGDDSAQPRDRQRRLRRRRQPRRPARATSSSGAARSSPIRSAASSRAPATTARRCWSSPATSR